MVNGQRLPVQLICHTKPDKNRMVYDSEKWSALPALSSGIFSFVFGAKLSSSCYIGDKGVYKKALLITVL